MVGRDSSERDLLALCLAGCDQSLDKGDLDTTAVALGNGQGNGPPTEFPGQGNGVEEGFRGQGQGSSPFGGCTTDADCGPGQVCELDGPGCFEPKVCVDGCHADSDCGAGEACNQVVCVTCPCPGICEPAPTGCTTNADCGPGQVCELDGPDAGFN